MLVNRPNTRKEMEALDKNRLISRHVQGRVYHFFGRPLLFLMMISLLVVRLPLPAAQAAAASGSLTQTEAVDLLRAYQIVRGEPGGALNLDQKVTRAQAATIFVRSRGAEQYAKAVSDLVPFHDAKGHWAAGEITMTERLGLMRGDGNGGFRPNSDITYAEVLTVLLRMLEQEPTGDWPGSVMAAANAYGIVPEGVSPMEPAVRGKIFWSLAMAISRLPLRSGETILRKYVDAEPPVLTVTQPAAVVPDAYVTIKGNATAGAVAVNVGSKPATLNSKTGDFSARADLEIGLNQIVVEALDLAGNKAKATAVVERRPPIARIDVAGPVRVQAGTATKLDVKAFYAQNIAAPVEQLEAKLTGDVATFDLASASLLAGTTLGKGTLILSAGRVSKTFAFEVTGPSPRARQLQITGLVGGALTANKENKVKVQVLDETGALVKDDNWRPIALTGGNLPGLIISPATALTESGEATFTVVSPQEGSTTLTAVSPSLTLHAVPAQFHSPIRVVLTATPATLTPDGTSTATIRATLQDEFGKAIANTTASDIRLLLSANTASGSLANPALTIRRGTSYAEATFRAGIIAETVMIYGIFQSEHRYSVQPLILPVTGSVPGVRLQVTAPTGQLLPGETPATITVRVLDLQDRLVTTGSYAFQFSVATSNGEGAAGGLPEGVQLTFPDTAYRPVDDGRAGTDPLNDVNAVVGRTQNGTATLQLRYNKSGTVTLTPRLVGATQAAYHHISGVGPAIGTAGMSALPVAVQFAAAPARIELTVDSALGNDLAGGTMTAGTTTLRARVLDRDGRVLPGFTGVMVLTRGTLGNAATEIVGVSRKAPVNGIAEFTVQTSEPLRAGFDTYTVGAGTLSSNQVTVSVRDRKAGTPVITAIRGVAHGNPSPTTGLVGPGDDFMEIQFERQAPPHPNEPANWVAATVFLKGEASPLVTAAAVDLNAELPVIRIPKSLLRIGLSSYEVLVNNGAGNTDRSPDWGMSASLNTLYNLNFALSSALLDSATGRLTISTSGLVSTGQVALEKIALLTPYGRVFLDQPGVSVDLIEPARVVITLSPGVPEQLNPTFLSGATMLEAQDGWFADGSFVARAFTTGAIRPMAAIGHAVLDEPARLLDLYGSGFAYGEFSAGEILLNRGVAPPVPLRPGIGEGFDQVASLTDSRVTIKLSEETLAMVQALPVPADPAVVPWAGSDIYLTAGLGWLKLTTTDFTYHAAPVRLSAANPHLVYTKATVSSLQWDRANNLLTFTGTGFSGVTVDPLKLEFRGTRRPDEAVPVWTGPGEVQILSDSVFTLKLSEINAANFDATLNGREVFVNTAHGWLTDSRGRSAARIPQDSVIFTIPRR
ncbi:MAG: putative middle wall protein precursor [Symbiobacteriaceae bacterium]|jgi:hypothetical protein|nr:putative middle wall protein precursor [Symbiobacteriaceae bacterium]